MVTEEDYKIVEARLQYDINNNIKCGIRLGILDNKETEASKN